MNRKKKLKISNFKLIQFQKKKKIKKQKKKTFFFQNLSKNCSADKVEEHQKKNWETGRRRRDDETERR